MIKVALWLVGGFMAFLVIGNLMYDKNDPKMRDMEAISVCWDGQAKKSNSAGDAQFIAGACERMEAAFQTTYGVKP